MLGRILMAALLFMEGVLRPGHKQVYHLLNPASSPYHSAVRLHDSSGGVMIHIRTPLLLAVLLAAAPVFAATPQLTEKVVLNGAFGVAPEQYGRAGLGASTKTTRLVNCFAANSSYIAVHDRVKRDVKIYTPAGAFDKAIRL